MTQATKDQITKISKEFSAPFYDMTGGINGSGWLIADPLSGYLNFCGFENKLNQIPASEDHPQILILTFKDGTQFIPAGGDLIKISPIADNWMWVAA